MAVNLAIWGNATTDSGHEAGAPNDVEAAWRPLHAQVGDRGLEGAGSTDRVPGI
eukprot:SAG31_NODE_32246_length_358_cov_0.679537_1_plen_53_part_10